MKKTFWGTVAIACLAMFGNGCALEPATNTGEDDEAVFEVASASTITTTTVLGCNLSSGVGLSTSPRAFKVESRAGVSSYRLEFTTSSATGTVGGKRPGVKGDGAFSGANFVFPYGTTKYTVWVSPGTGNLWKLNTAGEGVFSTYVRLLCS